jgi:predicted nucleic acid-binding protein
MRVVMSDDEVVTDASTLVCALTRHTETADGLRRRLAAAHCHAPHVVDAEVGHAFRRKERRGELDSDEARIALRKLPGLVDDRYPHTGLIAELAWLQRDNLTYYDALYVAVAAALRVPLLTLDARLAKAPNLPCEVELLVDD